ncbi:MAG TPA: tRNA uridine-5-carboxymethylaminomethyl(34) synthesis GTPase MnmE [Longimicrobiaceae bacterium]|jgi:tRNA modification GTPase|nr:tRNA uridine-5-carboxymethylaminomethyl(34) synthesis GTPase MnmE [Longimicrobiaceae bacterium]
MDNQPTISGNPFGDTIAAIATAPGRGAVAMLRVAGPRALAVVQRLTGRQEAPQARVQRLAALRHPETGELLDRALVAFFPAPASYTGDDTVEISTHGGALTPQLVLDALLAAGARPAQPGEFTRRAYLNGKLDLLQAEAVGDLIDGRSRALHRAAVHQMERGLSRRVEELRAAIIGAEALLIYSIDFPEEDEPPVPPARIRAAVEDVLARIDALLATAPEGEMLREGALTVLAGRPNSGKSSLFNALLGTERAIVTEVPGTTRDALEASMSVDGYPFRLVDTAGLRETADRVESIGIEVARRYLAAADLVLFCAEAGREMEDDERAFLSGLDPGRVVLVRTKADCVASAEATLDAGDPATDYREMDDTASLSTAAVSASTGDGLPELRAVLLRKAFGGILGDPGEAPLVTRERHARALRAARDEVAQFAGAFAAGIPMEFAATHLRAAVGALEDLVGVVTVDDLLDRVFGDFCVGK